jgi:shikimate kinase
MKDTIILIGPISSGKTTVAELLAKRLARPQVSMDVERHAYYQEIGYDEDLAQRKLDAGGWWARYRYWKPFEAYAVERILADHPGAVIDFGAGHSVYEDDVLFARVAVMLAPYPNVFLLLPSPDVEASLRLLSAREDHSPQLIEINRHFLEHHSNYDLAKTIVYTEDKLPEAVCEVILALIGSDRLV